MLVLVLARNRVRVWTASTTPPNAWFALPDGLISRHAGPRLRRAPLYADARRPSRVAGRQAVEEPVKGSRVVRVEGLGLPRADLGGVLIAAGEVTSAPSARARRGAPSPMPALPPITATACPARSGSRRLETLKWLRRSWFLRWMARRRVTGPPTVLASTEADAPVPRARLIQPRSSSSVISRVSFTSRNTTVADPDLLRQLSLAVLEDGGSAPLPQPCTWSAEMPQHPAMRGHGTDPAYPRDAS